MLQLLAANLHLAYIVAVRCYLLAQAAVEQLLAEGCDGLRVRLRKLRTPSAGLVGNLDCMTEGRRLHQLKVLLVLRGCAAGYLIDPLAFMVLEAAPARKSGKELVVPAPLRNGNKAAHGKRVDQLVIDSLVRGSHVPGEVAGRDQLAAAGRLGKTERDRVDADAVLGRFANKRLCIHRAREMDVQIGAFGKVGKKGAQRFRSLMEAGLHDMVGARLGTGGTWRRLPTRPRPTSGQRDAEE